MTDNLYGLILSNKPLVFFAFCPCFFSIWKESLFIGFTEHRKIRSSWRESIFVVVVELLQTSVASAVDSYSPLETTLCKSYSYICICRSQCIRLSASLTITTTARWHSTWEFFFFFSRCYYSHIYILFPFVPFFFKHRPERYSAQRDSQRRKGQEHREMLPTEDTQRKV